MIMYTFLYFFFFSFRAGGCKVFLPFVEQHNTFTAELLKVESADLTHTLYYFNFLLLFIHFSFYFTKSTSLEHPRLEILLYFVSFSYSVPHPRRDSGKVNERREQKKKHSATNPPSNLFMFSHLLDETHK